MAKIFSTIGLFANIDHNSTENIQGGTATERYHLTKEEYDNLSDVLSFGDKNFVFEQGMPTANWIITHNLGKYPSVTVLDSAKTVVEGEVVHNSINSLTIKFNGSFSGTATLN